MLDLKEKKLMKGPAATSVSISNQDNSKPTQISTSSPIKETTSVYTAPVTTPVIIATPQVETNHTQHDQAVPTNNNTTSNSDQLSNWWLSTIMMQQKIMN